MVSVVAQPSGRGADLHRETYLRSEPGQHVDQCVRTEQVDPPTEEIADAGLSHTEYLGRCSLFEAAGRDELLHLDHEVRSDQQMLGLLEAKPEVTEYIPGGRCDLQFHDSPPPLAPLTAQRSTSASTLTFFCGTAARSGSKGTMRVSFHLPPSQTS